MGFSPSCMRVCALIWVTVCIYVCVCMCMLLGAAERKIYARHTRVAEEIMRDGMLKAKKMVEEEKDKRTCIAGGKCISCHCPSRKFDPA